MLTTCLFILTALLLLTAVVLWRCYVGAQPDPWETRIDGLTGDELERVGQAVREERERRAE